MSRPTIAGFTALTFLVACAAIHAADTGRSDPLARIADLQPSPPRVVFADGKFLLRTNEVVVFTGPANVVFEQQQGWLETLLAFAARDAHPRFRHMGWEGDTVFEQTRDLNWGGWKENLDAVGASAVIAWFGQIEALEDTRTVEEFSVAYGKLLDEFRKATPRLVVLSPTPFEKPASPWIPNITHRNARVKEHADAARRIAAERGAVFVDLFTPLAARSAGEPRLTDNGLHFTPEGQRVVAEIIATQLGLDRSSMASASAEAMRAEIVRKNRFWFDAWRTMNWAFPYGDRTEQPFSKPIAGKPSLAQELENFKPLIRNADERIHALALGLTPPATPPPVIEPAPPTQPPDEELTSFKLREGFVANLFASERDGLIKPIQIRWDERGRLWAACTPSYPQIVPGAPASDFILVCEDTNGDGRADKFTKFSDGLVMPMGMEFVDGGLAVCEGTQLVLLRDTDGDGRADSRRVIASGFGTGDSHQLINSLRWGPDGRLWFTQGLHIMSRVETPWGLARLDRAGIWRMNPRTLQMHGFFGGAVAGANCWGVVFDNWGQVFHLAVDNMMGFYSVPGLIPLANPDSYYNVGPLAVSKAKGMELEIIGTAHFPDDLQGALVKSVYYDGSVRLYRLRDDGSGFVTDDLGLLISSTNAAFRPLESKIGPDGAMYICDWFNPIIGHYQASYRDPRRDKAHGRVWRIAAKDRPLVKAPALATTPTPQLLDQLRSPERWVREQVKQVLYKRPTREVIPAADAWLAQFAPLEGNATNAAPLLYEAIGVYAAHEAVRSDLLQRLLDSPEPRLRAFGTRMVGLWAASTSASATNESADRAESPSLRPSPPVGERVPEGRVRGRGAPQHRVVESLALLRKVITDPSPRVRLEAVVSASYVPSAAAADVVAQAADQPRDRFLDYAAAQSLRVLKPHWLPALTNGTLELASHPARLELLVKLDGTPDTVRALRGLASGPARDNFLIALAEVGDANDFARLLDMRTFTGQSGEKTIYRQAAHARVLSAMGESSRVRNVRPAGDTTQAVRRLLGQSDEAVRVAALRLAAQWQLTGLQPEVLRLAQAGEDPAPARLAAIEALPALGGDAGMALESLAESRQPPAVRAAAISSLAVIDPPEAAALAADALADERDDSLAAPLTAAFLKRRDGARALAAALTARPPRRDAARLALRQMQATGREDKALVEVLSKAAALGGEPLRATPEAVSALVTEVRDSANAVHGADVFRRADLNCATCHAVGGQGGNIGPSLDGLGAGQPLDFIIGAVLEPNKEVKESFEAIEITTKDGETYQGYRIRADKNELVLRDVTLNKEVRLRRDQIADQQNRGSVMPAGLVDHLTRQELRDLFRYLSELGKAKP